jgi:hypothetical protein
VSGDLDFDWDEGQSPESEDDAAVQDAGTLELIVGGEVVSTDPTAEDVGEALANLPHGDPDAFAILAAGDQYYVQAAGCAADGFLLEYREGSDDRHYVASGAVSLDGVVAAFRDYLAGDDTFKAVRAWTLLQDRIQADGPWKHTVRRSGLVLQSAVLVTCLAVLGADLYLIGPVDGVLRGSLGFGAFTADLVAGALVGLAMGSLVGVAVAGREWAGDCWKGTVGGAAVMAFLLGFVELASVGSQHADGSHVSPHFLSTPVAIALGVVVFHFSRGREVE